MNPVWTTQKRGNNLGLFKIEMRFMKTSRAPFVLLVLLYFFFFGCLAFTARQLPERVASHFSAAGEPNGWMSRSAYLQFIGIFGAVVPLFVVVVFRLVPVNLINVPNRDFWFAPERSAQSREYLFRQSFWFADLMIGFFIGVHLAVVQANGHSPAQLSLSMLLGVTGIFLFGILLWTANLFRRFSRRN
jgi:serine/threonine-protein kinase